MQIASVTYDLINDSLEVVWVEKTSIEYDRVRCHAYSKEQKDLFIADVGDDATRFVVMAGW